ncbi:MAG TPA: hypothetical protein VNG71_08220 [Pyrinomonadaceae bacterium]|nr:hypothetical protein [Pyrinomonadaceae bacterium]
MSLIEDLKKALADRIQTDMTKFGKWNPALWAKIPFGDYYGKSEPQREIIRRVVGETVDNVVGKTGWRMTADSWADLQGDIDASDTAETALPDMEEAALAVEKIPAGGLSLVSSHGKKKGP